MKIKILAALLLAILSSSCYSQGNMPKWEIKISSGQSFVDYYEGFGSAYCKGMTIKPEITYDFSRFFSGSLSILFTTAYDGDKNARYYRVTNTSDVLVSGFKHNQTTFAPEFQFSPVKTKRHNIYIGAGPTYSIGNSLLSQSFNEASTTMARSISEFGYQVTAGYKLNLGKCFLIGGNYIYNKNVVKTEHLLLSLGYKIQ